MKPACQILPLLLLCVACDEGRTPTAGDDAGPGEGAPAGVGWDDTWRLEELDAWYPEFDIDPGEDQSDDRWTLMMYEDGDNNLEHNLLRDINEMELADIPEKVNIIVLFDRTPGYDNTDGDWQGAKLFKIEHDENARRIRSPRLADPKYLGLTDSSANGEEIDMGAPETLAGFIAFCQERYPADHYILHLSGHGDGWRSALGRVPEDPGPMRAVCGDDTSKTALTARKEIPEAIAGKGIEAITLDACLMGTVEVAFALAPHTGYTALSASNVPQTGWPYTQILNAWFAHRSARSWVLGAVREFRAFYADETGLGLTAVALSEMAGFGLALNRFLGTLGDTPVEALGSARDRAFRPNRSKSPAMRDLVDLVLESRDYADPEAIDGLLAAYDKLIMAYWYSSGLERFRGLTIYAPGTEPPQGGPYQAIYEETPFARETGWDEFIRSML